MKKQFLFIMLSTFVLYITSCNKTETIEPTTTAGTVHTHREANRKGEQGCIIDGKMGIKCTSPNASACKADDGCHIVGITLVQTYFPSVTTNEQWLGTAAYSNDAFRTYLKNNGILQY